MSSDLAGPHNHVAIVRPSTCTRTFVDLCDRSGFADTQRLPSPDACMAAVAVVAELRRAVAQAPRLRRARVEGRYGGVQSLAQSWQRCSKGVPLLLCQRISDVHARAGGEGGLWRWATIRYTEQIL